MPPRLGELERRLTLARLVAAWAEERRCSAPLVVGGPASTLALAGDLARLMDDMVTRGVDWRRARQTGAGRSSTNTGSTRCDFLRIAREAWPSISQEIGRIEPAARRDRLIDARSRAPDRAARSGPVIAAGSTASMPATAKFLSAVAGLKQGAVVLPGLDTDLDEDAWQTIGGVSDAHGQVHHARLRSNHPQFAMQALLDRFGIKRSEVEILGAPAPHGRARRWCPRSDAAGDRDRAMARPARPQPDVAAKISGGMANLAVVAGAQPGDGSAGDRGRRCARRAISTNRPRW